MKSRGGVKSNVVSDLHGIKKKRQLWGTGAAVASDDSKGVRRS